MTLGQNWEYNREYNMSERNLMEYQHYLPHSIEQGFHVHILYTDYSQAFDSVDHSLTTSS